MWAPFPFQPPGPRLPNLLLGWATNKPVKRCLIQGNLPGPTTTSQEAVPPVFPNPPTLVLPNPLLLASEPTRAIGKGRPKEVNESIGKARLKFWVWTPLIQLSSNPMPNFLGLIRDFNYSLWKIWPLILLPLLGDLAIFFSRSLIPRFGFTPNSANVSACFSNTSLKNTSNA